MVSTSQLHKALEYGSEKGYLLFPEIKNRNTFSQLQNNPYCQALLQRVHTDSPSLAQQGVASIPYKVLRENDLTGSRVSYDQRYIGKLNSLATLVMETIVEGTDQYLGTIEEMVWDLCNAYLWGLTAHVSFQLKNETPQESPEPWEFVDLLAAETAFQLAETIHLIGHRLDPFLVHRVREEVERRIFEPFQKYSFWWESRTMNWAAVCGAGIGAAALHLIEDTDRLCRILGKVLASLESYLEGFDNDGVTAEGFGYWGYGFSNFTFFSELLFDRTAGKLSLLHTSEKIQRIAEFPAALILSNERTVNFSDSLELGSIEQGLACQLERRLGTQGLRNNAPSADHALPRGDHRWSYLSRALFWSLSPLPEVAATPEQGGRYFSEAEWLISKHWDENGNLLAFAAKGGHNDEDHNHNDVGSFLLHYGGINVFPELGSPQYNNEYFHPEHRYENLCASSKGHSVPVINGHYQKPGRERRAVETRSYSQGDEVFFELDMAPAYAVDKLQSLKRQYHWNPQGKNLCISDSFVFSTPQNVVEEVLICRSKPEATTPGKITFLEEGIGVEIHYDPSLGCQVDEEPYASKTGTQSIYRIRLHKECQGPWATSLNITVAARGTDQG